ncbi:MAG: Spore_germination_protein_CgeB, partial [uncultured Gemmatimonadaceae bacterium]
EDRRLLPLAAVGLEPRQRALPARRDRGAARPRPRRPRLRAARRLEPGEPDRRARRGAAARGPRGLPLDRPRQPRVRPRHPRPRRGARRRGPRARPRVDTARARGAHRRAPAPAGGGLPAAVPRHPPPRGERAGGDGALRPLGLRRRPRLRRGDPRPLPRPGLDGARLDLARGGRHPRLPPAPGDRGGGGPRVGGQLGRRRAHAGAARVPAAPRAPAAPGGSDPRRPLSARRPGADPPRRPALSRLAREPPGAGGVRPSPRHGPRPAAALRRVAAGHPDHPAVRGDGVRHPARLLAVGRRRGALPAGNGLPRGARRPRDGRPRARHPRRPGARRIADRARPGDGARPAHLRAPRGRAARGGGGARRRGRGGRAM